MSRNAAGELLARELTSGKNCANTLILALVRGGVVVGASLAKKLNLPLFPYIVRKLGHPKHREFAVGAIAEGGATYLDDEAMKIHSVDWDEMEDVIEEETKELARRKEAYLVTARPDLGGKTVILTDDGAATGATLFAAIEDLRRKKVGKLIVALPVCPPETALRIREKSDEAIILAEPENFFAVGQYYQEFAEVEDGEVINLLSQ
ncbi:phosphoribosyltransferase [Patescibacteria group bacterium]|nr:phosphoribosyltransferase [Patescibacteria group bacterium]MBU1124011.1 phosphoribosyltransferase [Patescibacteria group bacterium]MBU1911233.1 phosphoribosyltransferase [Patescibacteria group bacterium]